MTTETVDRDAEWHERSFDESARVDRIIHLATMASDAMDYDVWELLTDPEEALEVLPEPIRRVVQSEEWEEARRGEREEEFISAIALNKVYGWAVQMAAAKFGPEKNKMWSSTWAISSTKWFYAETYEEAVEAGFAWAGELHTKQRAAGGVGD